MALGHTGHSRDYRNPDGMSDLQEQGYYGSIVLHKKWGDTMAELRELLALLPQGGYDDALRALYPQCGGKEAIVQARDRAEAVVRGFFDTFGGGNAQVALFSVPGRTEIGGNHTDHQHGHVLCAGVDRDILACAAPNHLNCIRIRSEGYPDIKVDIGVLGPQEGEVGTSSALVRGVAAGIAKQGYLTGGFDLYMTSEVPSGSGLSSSAAFEVLIAIVINRLYCGEGLNAVEIAKIGQYAENVYFGKPCGLMDQLACSVGGVISIDLENPAMPQVRRLKFDLAAAGFALCVIDSGADHADLTDDYAGITREMGDVAAYFGKSVLREVSRDAFQAAIPELRVKCGDRAVLRAIHFFEDDGRAVEEADALERGDFNRFLSLVNESGYSSALCLQNTWSVSTPYSQPVSLVLETGRKLLGGKGAIRVHGGGFAGTVQAFVPTDCLAQFIDGMEHLLGRGCCRTMNLRPQGGCIVIE